MILSHNLAADRSFVGHKVKPPSKSPPRRNPRHRRYYRCQFNQKQKTESGNSPKKKHRADTPQVGQVSTHQVSADVKHMLKARPSPCGSSSSSEGLGESENRGYSAPRKPCNYRRRKLLERRGDSKTAVL